MHGTEIPEIYALFNSKRSAVQRRRRRKSIMNEARMSNEAYAWLSNLAKKIMIEGWQEPRHDDDAPDDYDDDGDDVGGRFSQWSWAVGERKVIFYFWTIPKYLPKWFLSLCGCGHLENLDL